MDENLEQIQQQTQENLELIQMFPWLTLLIFTLPLILVARSKVYPNLIYVVALFLPALISISIILHVISWALILGLPVPN